VQGLAITLLPFGEAEWRVAVDAFQRFGRGRHAAALNFDDCLAYASSSHSRRHPALRRQRLRAYRHRAGVVPGLGHSPCELLEPADGRIIHCVSGHRKRAAAPVT
jgi:hypothetical protein